MIRQTSIEAYHKIKENGLLVGMRFRVYEALYNRGPCSIRELYVSSFRDLGVIDRSVSPRFAELKRLGVIQEMGKRKCSVSGSRTIFWGVTDRLPLKLDKPVKTKCPHCEGLGYLVTEQTKLF